MAKTTYSLNALGKIRFVDPEEWSRQHFFVVNSSGSCVGHLISGTAVIRLFALALLHCTSIHLLISEIVFFHV